MELRRVVPPICAVLTVVVIVAWFCPTDCEAGDEKKVVAQETIRKQVERTAVEKTRFIVIVPPEEGIETCRVVPWERHMADSKWLTLVNLSGEDMRFEFSDQIADISTPTIVFVLAPDESKTIKLKDLDEVNVTYTVTSPPGGCFPELPSPRVIIP
jgi:hypothetical protein